MKCPKCRGETRVYDKRWFPIMNTKCGYDMRRRECKRCGYRFLTEETFLRKIERVKE